ncbi:MAG: Nucleolar protein 58 [Piccolia ochrophora]|nr:MAG: Nucleolar protein 58 [Piccolia ochrophora]
MTLLILAETSAGYALFKARDKKLLETDDLATRMEAAEGACSLLKLKHFKKFDSAASALEEVSALVEGKVTPMLASLLDNVKDEKKISLAVADPKLGKAINNLPSLSLTPISDSTTSDLYRAIRNHITSLIPGLHPQDISSMSLGLSHSLSRHKLKFSPDKVDTMVIQAIALLDDLDKELNIYAMRVKEWYGWHFPEMGRIVNDNLAYARVILKMGLRSNAANADLAEILPEEIEGAVKAAAEVSMGTEIMPEDLDNIRALAEQVVSFTEYRQQLSSYLSARMAAIAPNLTALVGELVGARLIAHSGSLMNLAKSPASTIQILGAEKALFRALKTKHDTPKYGLIYHASLIGQATGKNKGKIARMLATKCAIGIRVDALADWSAEGEGKGDEATEEEKSALGVESRIKLERRLRGLEGKPLLSRGVTIGPSGVSSQPGKWEVKEARKYNPDADGLQGDEPAAAISIVKGPKDKRKPKRDSQGDIRMIEEVKPEPKAPESSNDSMDEEEEDEEEDEDEDSENADVEMKSQPTQAPAPAANGATATSDESQSASSSDETPAAAQAPMQDALNEKPPKEQLTKAIKRARKKERHERKIARAMAGEIELKGKAAKYVREADRRDMKRQFRRVHDEKEQAKREQTKAEKAAAEQAEEAPKTEKSKKAKGELGEQNLEDLASQAGLSVSRYKRKLERGEISFGDDGVPTAVSKKDVKKLKKKEEREAAAKAEAEPSEDFASKKRKREEEKAEKADKKKKRKHAA